MTSATMSILLLYLLVLLSVVARASCFSILQHTTRPAVFFRTVQSMAPEGSSNNDTNEEPDLFDYFDPLLSPHAYPNGISPKHKPVDVSKPIPSLETYAYDPFQLSYTMKDARKSPDAPMSKAAGASQPSSSRPRVDTSQVFDPTLSPHEYANGTPDVIVGDPGTVYVGADSSSSFDFFNTQTPLSNKKQKKRVGILLMDHGSRSDAANQRIHELASLYQASMTTSNAIVRGAHMEIASPSIPEQLQELLDLGVDEIVCHPYFLSPGRHVKEDIPRIIAQAISDMSITIPIVTTDAIGSHTEIMLQAIHTLVHKSSVYMTESEYK
jgi:sirohydrochlorin ferrochelatase